MHSVSLPDPTEAMDAEFLGGLNALPESDRSGLVLIIEEAQKRLFAADLSRLARSDSYVAASPPFGVLHGRVASPADIAAAIDRVDLRWRLDAIMALDEYLI